PPLKDPTRYPEGGYYIYLEGNDGSEGDRAQLVSAPCKKTGAQCLRFWYHMYGVAQSMALKVYQVEGGIPVLMWLETGNKGNRWIAGEVGLQLSGKSQILIEAVRGNDYRSDVAVDDISFHTGCCGDMCDTTATTSTPTTAITVTPETVAKAVTKKIKQLVSCTNTEQRAMIVAVHVHKFRRLGARLIQVDLLSGHGDPEVFMSI
ncbi:hypothetical protein scyTo_0019418, partial [Scyliorhinus torazame]|nr:hypothetical protein [Scyliorhinus torazame]